MPDPITALVVGGTQVVGGMMQSKAASKAAGAQTQAAEMGIEEQRRQFDAYGRAHCALKHPSDPDWNSLVLANIVNPDGVCQATDSARSGAEGKTA